MMKRNRIKYYQKNTGILVLKRHFQIVTLIALLVPFASTYGQDSSSDVDTSKFIKGIVRDAATDEPIFAAQIKSLNHDAVATTNEAGEFTIEVLTNNELLLVNAFDYNTREVAVRGRKNIEIEMYPDIFKSDHHDVVHISDPDFSPARISSTRGINDLESGSILFTDNLIQEKLAGDVRSLSVSGNKGYGTSMFIRGLNSINLSSQPLFVVDGVFWSSSEKMSTVHGGYTINALADIDVNDIENITVLKDGTSLFGSKGGNGVVLINTKRGADMATKIVLTAMGGIYDHPMSLPMMNGDQYKLYASDMLGAYGYPDELIDELGFLQDDPTSLEYLKYHNSTNWDKEVYQKGNAQGYNISVNGGDERALYAFSMGYTGNQGVVKNNDMQRLNTRFTADFSLSDKVKTGLNIAFTNTDRNLLDDGVNYYTSPTYLSMIKAEFLNPFTYTTSGTLTDEVEESDFFGVGNPTAIIRSSLNTNKHYRLNMGLKPKFQITNEFSFSTQFDYSIDKVKETFYRPMIGSSREYITGLGYSDNEFNSLQSRNVSVFNDSRFHYIKQVGSYHRLNAIAGWRYIVNYYENDYAEGHNSGSEQKRDLLFDEEFKKIIGVNDRVKSISNYANVDYSYDKRYFLTLAVALDGSSAFGSETQGGVQLFNKSWGVFPSAQAAWLLSSEQFMANTSFIDYLNLRLGYGISGNDAIDAYSKSAYFIPLQYMSRANGIIIGNVGNTELQWETAYKMNLGADINLFNNRLSLNADVYQNTTKDLLTLQKLPDLVGDGYFMKNGGELSNKGFEVTANVIVVNARVLKWELGGSVGHYKNNIEALPSGRFTTPIYNAEILSEVGSPAGVFYGYKTKGVFTTYADAEAANLKLIDSEGMEYFFSAGDMEFEEVVADGIIDEKDKQIIGDPNPDYYGSLNNKFVVGNFTLDALVTFSYGNDVYNYLRAVLESGQDFRNQTTAVLNRWTHEGQITSQPKATYADPMGNARFSDRWIEDGSYMRLKSVTVNYKIPLKSSFLEEINVWASAENLLTLTNYIGRDPEVSPKHSVLYQGIDTGLIPVSRGYYIGIKLNL